MVGDSDFIWRPAQKINWETFSCWTRRLTNEGSVRIRFSGHLKWKELDSVTRILFRHCVARFYVGLDNLVLFEGHLHAVDPIPCQVRDYKMSFPASEHRIRDFSS